jgi:hypothetical protein
LKSFLEQPGFGGSEQSGFCKGGAVFLGVLETFEKGLFFGVVCVWPRTLASIGDFGGRIPSCDEGFPVFVAGKVVVGGGGGADGDGLGGLDGGNEAEAGQGGEGGGDEAAAPAWALPGGALEIGAQQDEHGNKCESGKNPERRDDALHDGEV